MRQIFYAFFCIFIFSSTTYASSKINRDSLSNFQGLYSSHEGIYKVKLPSVHFSYNCSYVILNLSMDKNLLRISTYFNCEDMEDQEFGALYLEIRDGQLFYNGLLAGSITQDELFLKVPDGHGFEMYHLKRSEAVMNYFHNSSIPGEDSGTLETVVKKI